MIPTGDEYSIPFSCKSLQSNCIICAVRFENLILNSIIALALAPSCIFPLLAIMSNDIKMIARIHKLYSNIVLRIKTTLG
jgi:hypothetical protein